MPPEDPFAAAGIRVGRTDPIQGKKQGELNEFTENLCFCLRATRRACHVPSGNSTGRNAIHHYHHDTESERPADHTNHPDHQDQDEVQPPSPQEGNEREANHYDNNHPSSHRAADNHHDNNYASASAAIIPAAGKLQVFEERKGIERASTRSYKIEQLKIPPCPLILCLGHAR
jgi:hypothetical protein